MLHVELLGPDARPIPHYARNVLALGGRIELSVPLARNDPPGPWTVKIRDVLSGVSSQKTFQVRAPR